MHEKHTITMRNKILTVDSFSMSSSEAPREARPRFYKYRHIRPTLILQLGCSSQSFCNQFPVKVLKKNDGLPYNQKTD